MKSGLSERESNALAAKEVMGWEKAWQQVQVDRIDHARDCILNAHRATVRTQRAGISRKALLRNVRLANHSLDLALRSLVALERLVRRGVVGGERERVPARDTTPSSAGELDERPARSAPPCPKCGEPLTDWHGTTHLGVGSVVPSAVRGTP